MRRQRLERELREFDFLCRLRCGRAASLDELRCAGMVLLTSCKGALPTRILPDNEEPLINDRSFDRIWSDVSQDLAAARSG